MEDKLQRIAKKLYGGDAEAVAELVQDALDAGMAPGEVLNGALLAGIDEVGRDFKPGDLFVPEVLIASRAMQAGMGVLRPLLGGGFEVIDLGTDVEQSGFVDAVREHKPDLVGMSAMLTTTMTQMKATIDALEEDGLRDSVKIMIGGAPVTAAFAEQIGAGAYATDAASAVDVARELKG